MHIMMICKYPPIQGGVSADAYWLAQLFVTLNHRVTIVTNSKEVEPEYRLNMDSEDETLLSGFWKPGSIRIIETHSDPDHSFIPQSNPFGEKLLGLALGAIEEDRPDLIFSYYLQPYGVTAMHLSMMSGIPYVIRHAGSDLGRLMCTEQLNPLYKEVFRRALFVLTRDYHHKFFSSIGVVEKKLLPALSYRLPGDLFHTTDNLITKEGTFTYYIFGKTGRAKGTKELIEAIVLLQKRNSFVRVCANWGGVNMPQILQRIKKSGINEEYLQIDSYIPHWHIPEKIRSSDAILFLENRFRISFHGPGIPAETNACGRHLVTTSEIRKKSHVQSFLNKDNTSTISLQELGDPELLSLRLEEIAIKIRDIGHPAREQCLDASLQSLRSRKFIAEQLNLIQSAL